MGGVAADVRMETEVPGLLVAGEAVGGANGANRLSGNAITEALAFGRRAGRTAAEHARGGRHAFAAADARATIALVTAEGGKAGLNTAAMIQTLQAAMADDVGPFRTKEKLMRALRTILELQRELGDQPVGGRGPFDMQRIDWLDLRNMILVARTVALSALRRTESRGAHQREDFPGLRPQWQVNQVVRLRGDEIDVRSAPVAAEVVAQ
ncbi:MAG TPA: succinate dehydrogenase, partial [Xanthobacteraceae bacterium]|nr:succinate dehydrogenase [Xanthobacteraceae bacterium]